MLRPLRVLLLGLSLAWAFPSQRPHFDSIDRPYRVRPPHCVQLSNSGAEESRGSNDSLSRRLQKQFHIGLHNTVCFRLEQPRGNKNETHDEDRFSWLHTITFAGLEHHHPVVEQYNFGIPEVHTDCICECDRTKATCSRANYGFTQCPADDIKDTRESCYRTFHSDQSPEGCDAGSDPRLCCDVKFTPYQNRTYTAVKLDSPSAFITLHYVAYDYFGGRWLEKDRKRIAMSVDGNTQNNMIDALKRLRLEVSPLGRTSHALKEGMYFAETNEGGEMESIRRGYINSIAMNEPNALGWYRKDKNGHFYANNGAVMMDAWHKAKALNCKEQRYTSNFLGVTKDTFTVRDKFSLPPPLEQEYPWIERAAFYDGRGRHVIVSHSEGTNLHITLTVADAGGLQFHHNASRISDFEGSIIVDSRSNRYLNVTVSEATGKLNGMIRAGQHIASPIIHSFTVYVREVDATNRSLIIPLPATVDAGRKMVCIGAEGQPENDTTCQLMDYHEEPLEVDVEHNTWRELIGRCPECNKVGVKSFVKYLNPLSWFGGLSDTKDALMVATDIFVYIAVLVVAYLVITKLIIPVCQCCVCPMVMMKIRGRAEQSNLEKAIETIDRRRGRGQEEEEEEEGRARKKRGKNTRDEKSKKKNAVYDGDFV